MKLYTFRLLGVKLLFGISQLRLTAVIEYKDIAMCLQLSSLKATIASSL